MLDIQFPERDFIYKNSYCDLYILSRAKVDSLIHYTMSTDFLQNLKTFFGTGSDCIISLRLYPFDIIKLNQDVNFVAGEIILGNVETGILATLIPNFSNVYFYDLGTCHFNQHYFDFRDFNPYTTYELYLPFFGYVELDYNKYWKHDIQIIYALNYQTGGAIIFLIDKETGRVIESYECQLGVDIPVGSTNYNQLMSSTALTAMKSIASITIGGGISASASEGLMGYYKRRKKKGDAERVRVMKIGSQIETGNAISSEIQGLDIPYMKGSIINGVSGYCGFYSPLKPHLKITRSVYKNPTNYAHNYGLPCMNTYTLNQLKGFTVVSEVHIEGVPATDDEIGMIESALKQGVLLPETVYELYPIRVTGNNITYNAPQYISSNETKTVTITVDENYSSQLEITGATYTTSTVGNVITITLTNPTANVNINVITTMKQFTVTKNSIGCTISGLNTVKPNQMYIYTITALEHYSLPQSVTVTGVEDFSYNPVNGWLSINNPVGNITISAYAVPAQYSISYTLNNVSAVGTAPTQINYGEIATITFEADSGYRFPNNITVTGASYTWGQSSGQYWELVLSEATENVTVTITATLIPTYTLTTAFTNMVVTSGTIPSVVDDEDVINITFVGAAGYTLPSTINVNGYNVPVNQGTATYGNCIADYSISNDVGTLSLAQFTGNTTASGTAIANIFSITVRAIDGSYSGDSTIVTYGTATVTITPNAHYSLPSSITVINASYSYNSTTGVVSLSYPTGDVGILATCVEDSFTLSNTITNLTVTSGTIPSTVHYSDNITITFTAPSGYTLPTSVTVNGYAVNDGDGTSTYGNCAADYSIYNGVGTLSLIQFTGNTTINASGTASVYSITNSITNGSASGASTIIYDGTATVTISANSGYALPSTVSVTNATSSYNDTTGVVTLSNPIGNVTITATCPSSVSYVIKAGIYYGKTTPDLIPPVTIPINFSSNDADFVSINIDAPDDLRIRYSNANNVKTTAYTDPSWWFGYRTITVNTDASVSLTQYNAFFNCFGGYGGKIHVKVNDNMGYDETVKFKFNGTPTASSYDFMLYSDDQDHVINVPSGVTLGALASYSVLSVSATNSTYTGFARFSTSGVITPSGDDWYFRIVIED